MDQEPFAYGVPDFCMIYPNATARKGPPIPGARKVGRVWIDDEGALIPAWILGDDSPIQEYDTFGLLSRIAGMVQDKPQKYWTGRGELTTEPGQVLLDIERITTRKFKRLDFLASVRDLKRMGFLEVHQKTARFVICSPILDSEDPIIAISGDGCQRLAPSNWAALREQVFERDKYTCQYCGCQEGPFECDHVVPVSKGGGDDPDNLKTACKPCNRSKGAKMPEEFV